MSIIGKHAHRLNAIIDDLLSLSRLEDGAERRAISFENHKLKPFLVTAIDLAIVKHIARVHRGYVTVESTLGKGSTFTIHLPER